MGTAVCLHIHVAAYTCTQNVLGGWIILEEGAHIGSINFGGGATAPLPPSSYTPAVTKLSGVCLIPMVGSTFALTICHAHGKSSEQLNIFSIRTLGPIQLSVLQSHNNYY